MRQGHGAFSFLKSGARRVRVPVFAFAAVVIASSALVVGTAATPSGASSKVSGKAASAALRADHIRANRHNRDQRKKRQQASFRSKT